MGGSAAKRKGSSFERDIANLLSEKTGESFIRAPGSGAYVGGSNAFRKEFLHEGQIRTFKGDVIPGPSYVHWNVECKSYADFPFHTLVAQKSVGVLDKWLDQMLDVEDDGDFNILFMKFNRKGTFMCFETDYFDFKGMWYDYDGRTWCFTPIDQLDNLLQKRTGAS